MMSFFRILVVVAAGLLWFAPVAIAQEPAAQTAQSSAEADEGEADGGDANPEADAGDSSNGDQETLASAATDLVDVRRDANAGDILAGGMLGALVLLAAIMMAMSVRAGAAAGRTISASLFLAAVAVYVAAQMRGPGAAQIGAPPGVAQAALMAGGCLYLALGAAATRSNVLLRALFLGGCAFAVTAGVFAVLDRPFSDLTLTIAGGLILVAGLAVLAIDALRGAPLAGAALPGGLAMALGLSALGWRAVASGPGEPLPAAPLLPLAAVSGGALLAGFATFAALGNASGVADRAAPPRRASKATKGDAVIGALKADDLMELLEYSGVGVWDWSARDDRVYATPGLRAALGDSSGAAAQDRPQSADAAPIDGGDAEVSWRSRIAPEDVETYEAFVRGAADPKDGPFDVRLRLATEDGDVAPFRFRGARAVDAGTGAPVRIAALVERDDGAPAPPPAPVSAAAPDLDALGGLPGRQALLAELTERSGAGLLLIGVDRFRAVNAALGFDGGDRLLATVASRLRSAVGEDGFAARCSGDVFAAVTAAPGFSERLMEAAEALRKRLSAPVSIGDEELIPSFSVGVAYAERMEGARPAEALLASAEAAMYEAKAEGGGRAVLYSPGAPGAAPASMSLETDLRRALERGEIEVHYQPIIRLSDGAVAGFEALARWRHPERGLVTPTDFIGFAEATDLIAPISRAVLNAAASDLAAWRAEMQQSGLFVGVNIDSRQVLRAGLEKSVSDAISACGLPPEALRIEVTESQIMADPEAASAVLSSLQRMGVMLALDDFGTGFSSLSYLHQFDFDAIKIDQSFTVGMDSDPTAVKIVRAIIDLAHDLSMKVVAEGAESEASARRLRAMGCDFAQGFIFGAAMTAAEAQSFIRSYARR